MQEDRPIDRLRIQLSASPLPQYYHWAFSYYHSITVMFAPVTITTAVKYVVLSPLPRYYRGITVVPITVQLSILCIYASDLNLFFSWGWTSWEQQWKQMCIIFFPQTLYRLSRVFFICFLRCCLGVHVLVWVLGFWVNSCNDKKAVLSQRLTARCALYK